MSTLSRNMSEAGTGASLRRAAVVVAPRQYHPAWCRWQTPAPVDRQGPVAATSSVVSRSGRDRSAGAPAGNPPRKPARPSPFGGAMSATVLAAGDHFVLSSLLADAVRAEAPDA